MDISRFKKIQDYVWHLPADANQKRAEVMLYASQDLLTGMDEKVAEQISNVAKLPGLIGPAMTMPDAHWGYGFPIGGVAAFDAEEGGIVSAGGVGFDISCGIRCLRTNLSWSDMHASAETIADHLYAAIPAGVGVEGKYKFGPKELDKMLTDGALWAVKQGFGHKEDLLFVEEQGKMLGAVPENVSDLAKKRMKGEVGTLGSGNHYLELQIVEKIFDQQAADAFNISEGQILISIHCGSRGLGHQIGSEYLISLAKEANRLGIHLPERELACAPILSSIGQEYLGAMNAGINCALANRQILTALTRDTLSNILPGIHIDVLYDVSHNTCKYETHEVDGKKRKLYVHRKGATRAFGPGHKALPEVYRAVGQPVVIGGSMGTSSYILAGNAPTQNKAFASASHGAGRAMSRHQALKQWKGRELIDELAQRGILIRSGTMRGIAEEAPGAYKDVDEVAMATEMGGLARRVALLRPKICVKG